MVVGGDGLVGCSAAVVGAVLMVIRFDTAIILSPPLQCRLFSLAVVP